MTCILPGWPTSERPALDRCRCGEPFRCADADCRAVLRRVAYGDDWSAVDEDGNTTVDRTPVFRINGQMIDMHEVGSWDRLATAGIGLYAALSARVSLGQMFFHLHRIGPCERSAEHPPWPVPECHGWPMLAAPAGWTCRIMGTAFPYSTGVDSCAR